MASVTINLNQDHRSTVRAVESDSTLTCTKTSAADAYTRGILKDEQHDLLPGESMIEKAGSTVTVRLFRKNPGDAPFSAELTLTSKGA
jgi:hypothetical protein